jgi:predicted N-acetyltransferase YhbS
MKAKSYNIRNMTRSEVEHIAIEWAGEESWNPGLHDADCFYAADPSSFFIGTIEGEPVSCISVVKYEHSFAFLGFYIVKDKYRGKGLGIKIWNAAIKNLSSYNIGLDGVIDQQSNYRKSGFEFAYNNIRYEGLAKPNNFKPYNIVELSKVPFMDLFDYDSKLFPAPRYNFLQNWLKQPESHGLVYLKNGKIYGYGLLRKCKIGYKIGPLFADNYEIAENIFLALNNTMLPSTAIFLDTPEVNLYAMKLAKNYGMQKVFETARMYTKKQPAIDLNKIFGVSSFELG